MSSLRDSIVMTLAYHDPFDYPLTSFEVWQQLVNPARLDRISSAPRDVALSDVMVGLDDLAGLGRIGHRDGLYCYTPERLEIISARLDRQKISAQKQKNLRRKIRWFRHLPYIRAMFVSGSLAMDNSAAGGDFDIFIIAQAGRLYTTRLLVSAVAWCLRSLRVKTDKSAPNKFCFNHYITTAQLKMESESIYTAHALANLSPLIVRQGTDRAFWTHNKWILGFFPHFAPPEYPMDISVCLAEKLLNLPVVHWLSDKMEDILRYLQQRRIRNNPIQYHQSGRIIATSSQLEFHPRSFEAVVINRYNGALKSLGFGASFFERDSGLHK